MSSWSLLWLLQVIISALVPLLLQLLFVVIVHMATNIMLPEGLSNYDAANMLVKSG